MYNAAMFGFTISCFFIATIFNVANAVEFRYAYHVQDEPETFISGSKAYHLRLCNAVPSNSSLSVSLGGTDLKNELQLDKDTVEILAIITNWILT